ncbi:hypothetical protein [Rubrimonas cliftonensis]|uniref:LTXXQ motif family protein n=1 Tax=Rubrimonas cliftonensis TaxID=89524 RepID=A0A1H4GE53_9RHOB|nr:hypothetical protein [Rubrimonas cliftonensis]SEB07895.1 hypothetical protein SAMN05444370_1593 [Rubrimonas cliftonensis]
MLMKAMALAALLASAGAAQAFNDPTWPCESRKVAHLSMAQMWAGAIPEDMSAWRDDAAVAAAAARIAQRRTSMDEVAEIIDALADATPEDALEARLTQLFAGVFALIDRERARVVDGITRYNASQQALSSRIDAMQVELARLEKEAAPDDFDALDRIDEMRDSVAWEVRIFNERRQSLQYVCESPVILEQRAFAVSRLVKARIDGV